MALFSSPPNLSLNESLHAIFLHYSSPWKSDMGLLSGPENSGEEEQAMDGPGFARMCRESPGLSKLIGRAEVDLIFNSKRPTHIRRLDYEHFLVAVLELAIRIFPDVDPTVAFSNFLARFVFSLFDQPPAPANVNVIDHIYSELLIRG